MDDDKEVVTSRTRTSAALIVVLATLTGLAPLATDMYVPGLPELTRSLNTQASAAQLTMTAFLIGIVVGQLILGPVSDAVGRRPVLLVGTALFTAFSVVCATAPTIEVLNAARLCQGIAGAAGVVVARAVITDMADGVAGARKFATLGAISSAAPILAPMLGGVVLHLATWRAVFAVLAAIGAGQILAILRWIPESLPPSRRARAKPAATLTAMATLIRRKELLTHVLSLCFGGAAVFVYIAGSTFVFQEIHGASTTLTSAIYGVNALGTMAGSILFGRLVDRFGVTRLLITGLATALNASVILTLLLTFTPGGLIANWACLFAMITAFGMFFPAVTTAAQSTGRDAPGTASALLGAGQFLLGGAISPLVGVFGTTSALPMAVLITACLSAATAVTRLR